MSGRTGRQVVEDEEQLAYEKRLIKTARMAVRHGISAIRLRWLRGQLASRMAPASSGNGLTRTVRQGVWADGTGGGNPVRSAPIRSAISRTCGYCHRTIYQQRDGTWYHEHNASVFCHLGDGSGRKAYPVNLYRVLLGLAA